MPDTPPPSHPGRPVMSFTPPWWTGVYGLDPQRGAPTGPEGHHRAAAHTAIACTLRIQWLEIETFEKPRWSRRNVSGVQFAEMLYQWIRQAEDDWTLATRCDLVRRLIDARPDVDPEAYPATLDALLSACTLPEPRPRRKQK